MNKMNLSNLPPDVKCKILCQLPSTDLDNVWCLSKQWCLTGSSEKFWQRKIQTDFPDISKNNHSMSSWLLYHNLHNSGTVYCQFDVYHNNKLVTVAHHVLAFQALSRGDFVYILDIFGSLYKVRCDPVVPDSDFVTGKNRELILTNIKQFCLAEGRLYYLTQTGELYEHNTGKKYADHVKYIDIDECGERLGYIDKNNELYCQLGIGRGLNCANDFYLIGHGIKKFKFLDREVFCIDEKGSLSGLWIKPVITNVINGIKFEPSIESWTLINSGIKSMLTSFNYDQLIVKTIKNEIIELKGIRIIVNKSNTFHFSSTGKYTDVISWKNGKFYSSIHENCGQVRQIKYF